MSDILPDGSPISSSLNPKLQFEQIFIPPQPIPLNFQNYFSFKKSSINWLITSINSFRKPLPDSGSVGLFFHLQVLNDRKYTFPQSSPENPSFKAQQAISNQYDHLPHILDNQKAAIFLQKLSESFSKKKPSIGKTITTIPEEEIFVYGVNRKDFIISLQLGLDILNHPFKTISVLSPKNDSTEIQNFFSNPSRQTLQNFTNLIYNGNGLSTFQSFFLKNSQFIHCISRIVQQNNYFDFLHEIFLSEYDSFCFISIQLVVSFFLQFIFLNQNGCVILQEFTKDQNLRYLYQTVKLIILSSHKKIPL
jgi:hypothetical protein